MRIETKDGTAPQPDNQNQPEDKYGRKLDQPYFELRVPDVQAASYIEGDVLRMIMSPDEKLSSFLATPYLDPKQTGTPRKRKILYALDPAKYKNLRPLDAIPASELEAFEIAAKEFYSKVDKNRKDVGPYEALLRVNFKLPDPAKEPDAYLVYGDEFERKLLVLWGCEKERGSALPLVQHEVVHLKKDAPTVVDALRRRVIGWEQMQKDVLLLMSRTHEPLYSYLAQPVLDEKGALKGLKIGEVALTAAQSRPLRYILPPEHAHFQKACQDFYHRAATATSAYEKELRTSFQLPDIEQVPEAFRVSGSFHKPKLLVIFDGTTPRPKTIWLAPAPELNIPPMPPVTPEQEILDQKPKPPPTLTDKLRSKVIPFPKIISIATGIAAVPVIIALIIWLALDKQPPAIKAVNSGGDPSSVIVVFDKAVDPSSLPKTAAGVSNMFHLKNESRLPLVVLSAAMHEAPNSKGSELVLTTGTVFADGSSNYLNIKGLRAKTFMNEEMKSQKEFQFQYLDTINPALEGAPSSDGASLNHLLLAFTKEMDSATAGNPANYSIIDPSKCKIDAATLDEDKKTVILTLDSPGFLKDSEHTIVIKDLKDVSKKGNKLDPNPTTNTFKFVDTMPPKLRHATPTGQSQVMLEFNEPLDATTAANAANYSLVNQKDGNRETVYAAQLVESNKNKVSLVTAPLDMGGKYEVFAEKIGDLSQNLITNAESAKFSFDGPAMQGGPTIETVKSSPDRTKITLVFKKENPLKTNAIPTPANFHIKQQADGRELNNIASVGDYTPSDPLTTGYPPGYQEISLVLSSTLDKEQPYLVSGVNLTDVWGHTTANTTHILKFGPTYPVQLGSAYFLGNDKRKIHITAWQELEPDSIKAENFHLDGNTVVKAYPGEAHNVIIIELQSPVLTSKFNGTAIKLRKVGSVVESPAEATFAGPDELATPGGTGK